MAITTKVSMNGLGLIKKIGVAQHLYDWLFASDVQTKLTHQSIEFHNVPSMGDKPVTVAITLNQLQKLNEGTMPVLEKVQLGKLISTAIASIQLAHSDPSYLEFAQTQPIKTLDKLPKLTGVDLAAKPDVSVVTQVVSSWPMFDIKALKTAPLGQLRDADKMYQPVKGSSGGSRYYVVAAGNGLRVAARYVSKNLSIRLEGTSFDLYANQIKNAGIDLKSGYASLHLEVADDLMAAKTLGAVLMGLGVQLESPYPNIQIIKGM